MMRASVVLLFGVLTCAAADLSFDGAQAFLKSNCAKCHSGKTGFSLSEVSAPDSIHAQPNRWVRIATRVRNSEMPPQGVPGPALDEREAFVKWLDGALHADACAAGVTAG